MLDLFLPISALVQGVLTLSIDMETKSLFSQGSNNDWLTRVQSM